MVEEAGGRGGRESRLHPALHHSGRRLDSESQLVGPLVQPICPGLSWIHVWHWVDPRRLPRWPSYVRVDLVGWLLWGCLGVSEAGGEEASERGRQEGDDS